MIAALLHDVPEDHGGQVRLDEIRVQFGDRVADSVEGLSDHLGAHGEKGDWWERKRAYVAHVAEADRSTQLVCLADKLHNIRCTIADHERVWAAVWDRFETGAERQVWYYRAIWQSTIAGLMAESGLRRQLGVATDRLERLNQ